MITNESPTGGLFEKLYAAGKELLDTAKKPLVRNQIKRKLSSAYDDASTKIMEAEMKISKQRESFADYDINKILQEKATIRACQNLQADIKEEYQTLFDKTMPVNEEE